MWESEDQRDLEDSGLLINSADKIDLSANQICNFKINFWGIRKMTKKIKLIFKNSESEEFIFFEIFIEVEESEEKGPIELLS